VKGLQAKNLRGNDPEELKRTLGKLRNDLFQHRLKRSTNQLENTMLIRIARREIARVMTVMADEQRQVKATAGRTAAPAKQAPKPKRQAARTGRAKKTASAPAGASSEQSEKEK
jgi:large subunit ribosomal protein L29